MGDLETYSDASRYLNETAAIMVSYRQQVETTDTLLSLAEGLRSLNAGLDIVIYDNSPVPMLTSDTRLPEQFRVTYLHDPSNPGVSKAYNEGAAIARKMGKKWLLLLDQDTVFPPDALLRYFSALCEMPQMHMFAPVLRSGAVAVSPCVFFSGVGHPLRTIVPGMFSLRNRSVLNSGMMVSMTAFDSIGGFNERIELDFADHDFCRRFAKRYHQAFILDLTCTHGFSDREKPELIKEAHRFRFYCWGARHSIIRLSDMLSYTVVVLVRCLVLSFRYKSLRFLPVFLRCYLLRDRYGRDTKQQLIGSN